MCRKCVKCGTEKQIHEHHVIPRRVVGKKLADGYGRILLCQSCHKSIHLIIKNEKDIKIIHRETMNWVVECKTCIKE